METEFEKLVAELDSAIEAVDRTKKIEKLGVESRALGRQLEIVDDRLAKLASMGGVPGPAAEEAVEKMRKRKAEVDAELASLAQPEPKKRPEPKPAAVAAPAEPPPRATRRRSYEPPEGISQEMLDRALDEYDAVIEMLTHAPRVMSGDEALYLCKEAALRYRIATESIGNPAKQPGLARKCYAAGKQFHKDWRLGWIDAFNRDVHRDWAKDLAELRKSKMDAEASRQAAEEEVVHKIGSAMADYIEEKDPEKKRLFLHAVREGAKHVGLREEIAVICRIVKPELLAAGFEFLWASDGEEVEEAPREEMTRQGVAQRLLRRILNKGIIGGKHAPKEMLWRGFPKGNAEGLAVELVELLEKCGMFAGKNTNYGKRTALAVGMVGAAKKIVAGERSGVPAVDKWIFQEEA